MQQPTLIPVPHTEKYEVVRDFEVQVENITVVVPRFFRYDGASIPAPAWQIIHSPFNPLVMGPALVHDWLYYNHQVDRETADDIFEALLRQNGVESGKRFVMWAAVRTAGNLYWDNDSYDIEDMIRLCRKVQGRKNFNKYCFPQDVVQKA